MSEGNALERRYRRLLKLYPAAFRREREDEVLAVLMDGAAPGQRRPTLGDCVDLVRSATGMRIRSFRLVSKFALRHSEFVIWVRLLSGTWLGILTLILCRYGQWWGLGLVPFSVLHFYLAYRVDRAAKERSGRRPPSQRPPTAVA